MRQTVIQIPLNGLLISLTVIIGITVYLIYKLSSRGRGGAVEHTEGGLVPFSEPRSFPEPIPPVRMPAAPVVPVADKKMRPSRYAYEQQYFERHYAIIEGSVDEVLARIGDVVKKGDTILKIRHQGIECDLRVSAEGRVREINCKTGNSFRRDDLLYVIQ